MSTQKLAVLIATVLLFGLILVLLIVFPRNGADHSIPDTSPTEDTPHVQTPAPDTSPTEDTPQPPAPEKPVIYLYPTEKTEITVALDYDGVLDYTYPAYNGGWHVTAYPDGTIINRSDNREYSYLFWEGHGAAKYDFSRGFVIPGCDTEKFLRETLENIGLVPIGLVPREYNEFIVYWLPKMKDNAFNLIAFQQEAYTDGARLSISPEPDSVLRVFMAYKSLNAPVEIPPQELGAFTREGFTVIEWGGSEVK